MGGLDHRRLAAFVSAGVVAYSRHMEADETCTSDAQRAHRSELIGPSIAGHGGRIVKTMGDGLLLEFKSVVDAVTCAIEIQRTMVERNMEFGNCEEHCQPSESICMPLRNPDSSVCYECCSLDCSKI